MSLTNPGTHNPVVDRESRKKGYDPTESGATDEIAKPQQPDPEPRQLSPEEKARAERILGQTVQQTTDRDNQT